MCEQIRTCTVTGNRYQNDLTISCLFLTIFFNSAQKCSRYTESNSEKIVVFSQSRDRSPRLFVSSSSGYINLQLQLQNYLERKTANTNIQLLVERPAQFHSIPTVCPSEFCIHHSPRWMLLFTGNFVVFLHRLPKNFVKVCLPPRPRPSRAVLIRSTFIAH